MPVAWAHAGPSVRSLGCFPLSKLRYIVVGLIVVLVAVVLVLLVETATYIEARI